MGDLEWSPASGVKSQQTHLGCYCSYTWGVHRKEDCQKYMYEKFSYCIVLLKPNSSRKIKFISGDNTAMFRKGFLLQHKLIIYLKFESLLEKMHSLFFIIIFHGYQVTCHEKTQLVLRDYLATWHPDSQFWRKVSSGLSPKTMSSPPHCAVSQL